MKKIDQDYAKKQLKKLKRQSDTHKYNYGHTLIIAGSYGMAGASIMCGKACMRSGSGLVTYALPKEIINILQVAVPEAMCLVRDKENINLSKYDTIIFGPGLKVTKEGYELLKWILENYNKKLLVDADGLNIISQYEMADDLFRSKSDIVITPHKGEAKRLLESIKFETLDDNEDESYEFSLMSRQEIVSELALQYNCTAILKGAGTLVCRSVNMGEDESEYDSQDMMINTTGNPGMATAGSGDVLSGIIGGLLSQGLDTYEASCLGVYLHGLSGDISAKLLSEVSVIATDLIKNLPQAITNLSNI